MPGSLAQLRPAARFDFAGGGSEHAMFLPRSTTTMRRLLAQLPLLLALLLIPLAAAALPPPLKPAWLVDVEKLYDTEVRGPGLEDRKFSPEQ